MHPKPKPPKRTNTLNQGEPRFAVAGDADRNEFSVAVEGQRERVGSRRPNVPCGSHKGDAELRVVSDKPLGDGMSRSRRRAERGGGTFTVATPATVGCAYRDNAGLRAHGDDDVTGTTLRDGTSTPGRVKQLPSVGDAYADRSELVIQHGGKRHPVRESRRRWNTATRTFTVN